MKIKVTKINFDRKARELLEKKAGLLSMFADLAEVNLEELPDEQEIWIDTKWIAQIDTPLPEQFSQGSFAIHYAFSGKDDMATTVYIKSACYDTLLTAWKAD